MRKLSCIENKEFRSRSHDPTSNRYFRGSIQLNEIEKISECQNRRINSVRKDRKHTNATMIHNNLATKLAFSKFINYPPKKFDKEYKELQIPSNELIQPKFDIFHHLNKFKIEQNREFALTARFGQANQPKCAEHKQSILTARDSKISSPVRCSFLSDECHDNFRYTFFPTNESDNKYGLNTKTKNFHRLPKIVINKKNFVFKDAIEQIRKDKISKASQSRKRLNSFKSRDVLSDEDQERQSKRCFSNDVFSVGSEDFETIEQSPFDLVKMKKSQKKLKVISKKIKKRPSDPVPLSKIASK